MNGLAWFHLQWLRRPLKEGGGSEQIKMKMGVGAFVIWLGQITSFLSFCLYAAGIELATDPWLCFAACWFSLSDPRITCHFTVQEEFKSQLNNHLDDQAVYVSSW